MKGDTRSLDYGSLYDGWHFSCSKILLANSEASLSALAGILHHVSLAQCFFQQL